LLIIRPNKVYSKYHYLGNDKVNIDYMRALPFIQQNIHQQPSTNTSKTTFYRIIFLY